MIQPKILTRGELLWDLLPGGAALGGAPVNFGCHAALGISKQVDKAIANPKISKTENCN